MENYILFFESIDHNSRLRVGGKNASLGEMYRHFSNNGELGQDVSINIPYGFAITTEAYDRFIEYNNFLEPIRNFRKEDKTDGSYIRNLIVSGKFPIDLQEYITNAYTRLNEFYSNSDNMIEVAVRSSSINEDSVTNSFAGQQDTYLNIRGISNLLLYIKKCFASLFTDRVLYYSKNLFDDVQNGDKVEGLKMSVCIQKMVRSDLGVSGVLFTIDTESGFRNAVIINASYGLGELVVGGLVDPDEYTFFKSTGAIIDKKRGLKREKLVYSNISFSEESTVIMTTSSEERNRFCLNDSQIEQLGKSAMIIEKHYSNINNRPVDIEWAFDGLSQELFIVQARPETTTKPINNVIEQYRMVSQGKKIISGIAVGEKIASGKICKMRAISDIGAKEFNKGDILVVDSTTPDWEPVMKIASGIITNRGGRTCHAAIIAREQGITAIVGTNNALEILEDNMIVTVSCAEGETGNVYDGKLDWDVQQIDLNNLFRDKNEKPQIMFNLASPEIAFKTSILPNAGVGLAREEFIINNFLKIHPLALLNYESQDEAVKNKIDELTLGYARPLDYYVEKLAFGIAKIGAAFYPNDVIVRFSDFKSNEYRNLLGGARYEPIEENPMIGWRGASRYYSGEFAEAFGLECKAIKRVREQMHLTNVVVMIPFCRTPEELLKVYEVMNKYGLKRGSAGLRVFLMAEIPSNVILAEEFSKHIDGFSIGSNDLTQLVLGLDRDSHLVSHIYDERNPAVKLMISQLIKVAKKNNIKCGICGQAPSDKPDFVKFLIDEGIDSISITPDSLLKTLKNMKKWEYQDDP